MILVGTTKPVSTSHNSSLLIESYVLCRSMNHIYRGDFPLSSELLQPAHDEQHINR